MCFWSESKCMWQMGGFLKWRSVSKNKIKFKNQRILDFRSAIQNPRLILQNRFYFISNTFVVLSKPMLYTRLLFTYLLWMSWTYYVPLGQRTVIPWVKTQLSVIGHPFELFRNYGYAGSQFDSKKSALEHYIVNVKCSVQKDFLVDFSLDYYDTLVKSLIISCNQLMENITMYEYINNSAKY